MGNAMVRVGSKNSIAGKKSRARIPTTLALVSLANFPSRGGGIRPGRGDWICGLQIPTLSPPNPPAWNSMDLHQQFSRCMLSCPIVAAGAYPGARGQMFFTPAAKNPQQSAV